MRKLIYFPIASLMAITGKSRPQGKQAGYIRGNTKSKSSVNIK